MAGHPRGTGPNASLSPRGPRLIGSDLPQTAPFKGTDHTVEHPAPQKLYSMSSLCMCVSDFLYVSLLPN